MDINKYIRTIKDLVPGQMNLTEQTYLLSTLEAVLYILKEQTETIQSLKDEINRLQGEQGKPNIPGKNQKEGDISSEKERKKRKVRAKKKGVKFDATRRIDETEIVDNAN